MKNNEMWALIDREGVMISSQKVPLLFKSEAHALVHADSWRGHLGECNPIEVKLVPVEEEV